MKCVLLCVLLNVFLLESVLTQRSHAVARQLTQLDKYINSPEYLTGSATTKEFEGFRNKSYMDTTGHETVGYGFNRVAHPDIPASMNKTQADAYFPKFYNEAIATAEKFASPELFWDLTPVHRTALIDLAYNLGPDRLAKFVNFKSNMRDMFKIDDASKELKNSKWYEQTGRRGKFWVDNWLKKDLSPLEQFTS